MLSMSLSRVRSVEVNRTDGRGLVVEVVTPTDHHLILAASSGRCRCEGDGGEERGEGVEREGSGKWEERSEGVKCTRRVKAEVRRLH